MNKHSPLSHSGSLLERAAELYGFGSPATAPVAPVPEPEVARDTPAKAQPEPESAPAPRRRPGPSATEEAAPALRRGTNLPVVTETKASVDRKSLGDRGFIVPDSPAGPLAEEFRIVKRQLLLGMG
ncbi:MAG: chromosome partitioning protein, partial [Allosphingosinicella sp.]